VQQQATYTFLKCLHTHDRRIALIEGYHRRILTSVAAFQASSVSSILVTQFRQRSILIGPLQITSLLNIQDWQSKYDEARANDQRLLFERFGELEANHGRLMEALSEYLSNIIMLCHNFQLLRFHRGRCSGKQHDSYIDFIEKTV